MKFKNQYPIQKYAIDDYLEHDLNDLLFNYTLDWYEIPLMSDEEKKELYYDFERNVDVDWKKELFKNEKVSKRFIKELEDNFVYNDNDSFAYTCRCASENGLFRYSIGNKKRKLKQDDRHNNKMIRIFNPVLDELAQEFANNIENTLEKIRQREVNQEIELMEKLAKKHGRKFK